MTAVRLLRDHGIGLTDLRLAMIEALEDSQAPLCYDDFKLEANKTTFYRNMELFERQGIVSRADIDGRSFYTLHDKAKAYFVCDVCHEIENIPVPEFSKKHVSTVVVKGVCDECDEE